MNHLKLKFEELLIRLGWKKDPNEPFLDYRIAKHTDDTCRHIAEEFGFNRVSVMHRHNGGKWKNGNSIQKLTAHYNYTEPGLPKKVETVNAIHPVGNGWTDLYTEIYMFGYAESSNLDTYMNKAYAIMLKGEGVTSFVCMLIKHPDRPEELGLLMCETVGIPPVQIGEAEKEYLKEKALKIGKLVQKKYGGNLRIPKVFKQQL